jgi:hypothetical protein
VKHKFLARIYIVGINPCVKVPRAITKTMVASKGYIPIRGKINKHPFIQTLVPVKGEPYRLHVNGPMLRGANVQVSDKVEFEIEQGTARQLAPLPMKTEFRKKLHSTGLWDVFASLTPSRRKEILKYMSFLKSADSVKRNIERVITQLSQLESAKNH